MLDALASRYGKLPHEIIRLVGATEADKQSFDECVMVWARADEALQAWWGRQQANK